MSVLDVNGNYTQKIMKSKSLITLLFASLFVILFYHKTWGLNLLLFQLSILGYLTYSWRKELVRIHYFLLASSVVTILSAFVYHSYLGLCISAMSMLSFAVSLHEKELKSIHIAFLSSILTIPQAFGRFVLSYKSAEQKSTASKFKFGQSLFYMLVVPIILLFLFLYGKANPSFEEINTGILDSIEQTWVYLFADINWDFIFYFLLGISITVPLLFTYVIPNWLKRDIDNVLDLSREKIRKFNSQSLYKFSTALKLEVKIGQFLLIFLNISLLLLLFFEIRDVWFGFTWDGGMLKEFVHQGIWILIISILISMMIALYFFRDNLNFFSKANKFKIMMYVWVGLNIVLTLSVFVRTFIYIEYFALAYKRIGLLFFLVAVVIGLVSIGIKLHKKKNLFFLLRVNSWAVYCILVSMCFVNWDVVIAKYNLSRKHVSFVHLNFMVTLSDKALPYLDESPEELKNAQGKHKKMLRMSSSSFENQYMKAETFGNQLKMRKQNFIKHWEGISWLEWNPANHFAYQKLTEKELGTSRDLD